jgi:hypothetical protein
MTVMLVINTENVVRKALKEVENNQLIPDYEKNEKKLREILNETAQKEAGLTAKMVHMNDSKTMREVEKELSAIFGHERVDIIKTSFAIETYRMKVVKKPDGQSAVQVYQNESEIQPEKILTTIYDINMAIAKQSVSLIVELFICVYSCAGIGFDLRIAAMTTVYHKVETFVLKLAFQRARNIFVKAWNEAGVSVWGKAKAIFYLLKENDVIQLLWKFTNLIFKKTSTRKKIRTIGQIAAMIVATFFKYGAALIARFALAVDNGVYLAEKIVNLVTLFDLKKTMN